MEEFFSLTGDEGFVSVPLVSEIVCTQRKNLFSGKMAEWFYGWADTKSSAPDTKIHGPKLPDISCGRSMGSCIILPTNPRGSGELEKATVACRGGPGFDPGLVQLFFLSSRVLGVGTKPDICVVL